MGLATPVKTRQRQEQLEKAIDGHPLRREAEPMIQQAFKLWDDVRSTSDPWPLHDIEKFATRCIEINKPMDEFRRTKAIPGDSDTYQNVIVFTNRWHNQYCTEAIQRLMEDLRKELEAVGSRAEATAAEIREYLGANIDGYLQQGRHYNRLKRIVWGIVQDYKAIERANDLIEQAAKQKIDTESTYKGAIERAMEALNELREDFFKHGDYYNNQKSATFLFWTLIVSLGAFLLAGANFAWDFWKGSQAQRVQVEFGEDIGVLLQQAGVTPAGGTRPSGDQPPAPSR